LLLALTATGRIARADPQASAGVTLGAAFPGVVGPSERATVHLGGRADVLFLRSRERDMALGPYLDVATAGFRNVDAGGGAEWLLPVTEDVPVVLSTGGFVRSGAGRNWAPGLAGSLFCGSRSYNFHSWYGLAVGVFVQTRWLPESPATLDVVGGVQLDVALLVMPVLFAYTALTHSD
jgi:hypothetical protein